MNAHERVTMGAIELLHTRESATKLAEPAPDAADLESILAAAVRAPDHGRLRPWRFIVIRGQAREAFGDLMAAAMKARCPDTAAEGLARERAKALRAPLIVVVAAHVQDTARIPQIEQVLSAGAAAQNIMLAAHALGYGAMWKTGDPAYDDSVKAGLHLDANDQIVGFLYLGTRAARAAPGAPRPTPQEFVTEWEG